GRHRPGGRGAVRGERARAGARRDGAAARAADDRGGRREQPAGGAVLPRRRHLRWRGAARSPHRGRADRASPYSLLRRAGRLRRARDASGDIRHQPQGVLSGRAAMTSPTSERANSGLTKSRSAPGAPAALGALGPTGRLAQVPGCTSWLTDMCTGSMMSVRRRTNPAANDPTGVNEFSLALTTTWCVPAPTFSLIQLKELA